MNKKTKPGGGGEIEESIIDSLSSGVMVFDSNLRLLMANHAAAENLEVQIDSLARGERVSDLPLPAEFRAFVENALNSRRPLERQEVVIRAPDGSRKEIGLSGSLLRGPADFNGMVFLFVDMTERRALERAAELNRQLAQIGGLTAGVVHELRNPLSVISGLAELIQRKMDEADPRRTNVLAIADESHRMERSISQFLGFARPFELEPILCGPRAIVQRAIALSRGRAEKKGVKVELRPGPALPEVRADLNMLAQALNNIITNAVDAVDKGGKIEIDVHEDDEEIVFDIIDNGPGVHVGEKEDIFSPFFTRKESGTGLGLAICHRIVTAHGGSVAYKNREEGGAEFSVRIPVRMRL
ncbi:MAG: ATP-binding protein [Candidatus Hydrogenedentes bacterium]|nr:ATP-binding protein [Candidatus Hydrogenedentota bacterium]